MTLWGEGVDEAVSVGTEAENKNDTLFPYIRRCGGILIGDVLVDGADCPRD